MTRAYRCFRCGRDLSNEVSVELGIGPICRQKRAADEAREDKQRQLNLRCHHDFTCYAPDHAGATLSRFVDRFGAMADQCGLAPRQIADVAGLVSEARHALGLLRPRVQVPEVEVPIFGMHTVGVLNLPLTRGPHGASYAMPYDHDDQYRRIELRAVKVCPFGLDCREPDKAVRALWRVLSILRYEVEPLLATEDNHGWAWDRLMYQRLWNTFEVLGLDDDARDIRAIVDEQRSKPVSLHLFGLAEEADR